MSREPLRCPECKEQRDATHQAFCTRVGEVTSEECRAFEAPVEERVEPEGQASLFGDA